LKRTTLAAALLLAMAGLPAAAGLAHAADSTKQYMGGIGFRAPITPLSFALVEPQAAPTIGVRHWFNGMIGFDLAAGYYQAEIKPLPEKFTGYTVEAGLPITLKRPSEKVNLILRPGFQWGSLEDESGTPTIKWTGMTVSGEFEVEWMVADNLSVSAAHGFGYTRIEDDGSPKTEITTFRTTGSSFTNLGFHIYLW